MNNSHKNFKSFAVYSNMSAFTLIELLVVIAIIGILAGLFFPAITLALARGKSSECQNNLRQWGSALNMYLNENNGLMPTKGGTESDKAAWYNSLPPYVDTDNMIIGGVKYTGGGKSIYLCPSAKLSSNTNGYYCSYGYNDFIDYPGRSMKKFGKRLRLSQVQNPSIFVAFADTGAGQMTTVSPTIMQNNAAESFRHAKRANICFLDGHVQGFRIKDIFPDSDGNNNKGGIVWDPEEEAKESNGGIGE